MGGLNEAHRTKAAGTAAALFFRAPLFDRRAPGRRPRSGSARPGPRRSAFRSGGCGSRSSSRSWWQCRSPSSARSASPAWPDAHRPLLPGEDQRFHLPGSTLTRALVLTTTSPLVNLVLPGAVLPIGVAAALVGVLFFVALVLGRRERAW